LIQDVAVLPLPALLLLVAIGAVGLYLALPRGPESETRAVRLAGAGLGAVSATFLALATLAGWRALPGWEGSRLDAIGSSLLFHGLALIALLSAGAAVTSRTARGGGAASAVLLVAGSGLMMFAGRWWAAAALLVIGAAIVVTLLIHNRRIGWRTDLDSPHPRERTGPVELVREPLLACAAGALLATGLLAAAHKAVIDELPLTTEVERNHRPPSPRYRAFPRTSALQAITQAGATDEDESKIPDAAVSPDLPLLHRLLGTAVFLFAVGIAGTLCRRSVWALGLSGGTALLAVAVLVGAVSGLPFRAASAKLALLPVVVLAVEGGLLIAVGAWLSSARAQPNMPAENASGGPT
jgi:hypothetical protein